MTRALADGYLVFDELATGGMASVHLGCRSDRAGGAVAIKRMHPHLARDAAFKAMFLDEARLVSRIRHPNVVPVLDVVHAGEELSLVMELVQGEVLSALMAASPDGIAPPIATAIAIDVLRGLHAAHEATDERGEPLLLVHRDVSPQNVMVGRDGRARVVDFGIAKAIGRIHTTRDGQVKGKASYMAPEQLRGDRVDRRTDVYATATLLWEGLAGRRLFDGETPEEKVTKILEMKIPAPSTIAPAVPSTLDAVVLQGLARKPDRRFGTALEMADALALASAPATREAVAAWLETLAGPAIATRARRVAEVESAPAPETLAAVAPSSSTPAAVAPSSSRKSAVVPASFGVFAVAVIATVVLMRTRATHDPPSTATAPATVEPPPLRASAAAEPPSAEPASPAPPVESARQPETGRRRPSVAPRSPAKAGAPSPGTSASTGYTRDRHE